jgi:CheY-like chemotaxis protein
MPPARRPSGRFEGDVPAPPVIAGCGLVLVVDDEPVVRQMAGRLLERLGYTALLAASGEEAVGIAAAYPDAVVLLDLVMPGLDGRETFLALRKAVPSVRVVVSSGFSLDGRGQELLDLGACAFLQKPYSLQQLSEAIAVARA